jgi:hypothetical protein
MTKLPITLAMLLLSCSIAYCQLQQAAVTKQSAIDTRDGGILVANGLNKLNLFFFIEFKQTQVSTTQREGMFLVGNRALQIVVVKKSDFKGDNETALLQHHATSELAYLSEQVKSELVRMIEPTKLGKIDGLRWSFLMPEAMAAQVKSQRYVSFIHDDFIIALSSPQFANQTTDDIDEFLKATAQSIVFSKQPVTLEDLCIMIKSK